MFILSSLQRNDKYTRTIVDNLSRFAGYGNTQNFYLFLLALCVQGWAALLYSIGQLSVMLALASNGDVFIA